MKSLLRTLTAVLMLSIAWASSPPDLSAADAVKLEKKDTTVDVTIGGKEFTVFNFDKSLPKPYFLPVRAADGAIMTRGLDKPEEHPHHKGVWMSIDEVNEIRFWAEKGKIENVSVEVAAAEGNPARLKIVNHWLGDDGKPVLIEATEVSIFANRLIAYDARLTAAEQPVTFGDTKEGMFGIRVANTLREKEGGSIVNAEGLMGEKACWGLESKWVDYDGMVDGKTYGVAIFDNPQNFRRSRYHVRGYGLFTISPFGQSGYTSGKLPADPYKLEAGKSVRLRYGLYVHDGDTQAGHVPEVYDFYLKYAAE